MTDYAEAEKALDLIDKTLAAPLPVTEVKVVREALKTGADAEKRLHEVRLLLAFVGPGNWRDAVSAAQRLLEGRP